MSESAQLKRLTKRIDAIPQAVRDAVKPTLVECAGELADAMRDAAPDLTGELRGSITVTEPGDTTPAFPDGSTRTALDTEAIVSTNSPHAGFIEHGTVKMAAEPFFLADL